MSDFYFPRKKKSNICRHCKIISSASYFPERHVSNEDIIENNNLPYSSSSIISKTGVEKRHVADITQDDSDLLLMSAKKCLETIDFLPDNLSRLIVNKYYGDNLLPMTASRLQNKLGSNTAVHAFDIDGGISSFLHSVDAVSRFINTGDDHILLSSGGIVTRLVSKADAEIAFLFGDGSASLLFGFSEDRHILSSYFYSNHKYYYMTTSTIVDMTQGLPQNGNLSISDTYKLGDWTIAEDFYRKATIEVSKNILEESGLNMSNIDLVLVTENNRQIRELTLDALNVNEDKSISLLRDHGNTMSAMLPLLLDHGFRKGKIQKGMNIMLISHGEGFSGGGLIYRV